MATQTRDFFDNPKSKGNQSDRLSPPPAIGKRCCSWERKRTEKDIHKIGPHRVISLLKCKVTHISSGGSRLLLKWPRQSHFWVQGTDESVISISRRTLLIVPFVAGRLTFWAFVGVHALGTHLHSCVWGSDYFHFSLRFSLRLAYRKRAATGFYEACKQLIIWNRFLHSQTTSAESRE